MSMFNISVNNDETKYLIFSNILSWLICNYIVEKNIFNGQFYNSKTASVAPIYVQMTEVDSTNLNNNPTCKNDIVPPTVSSVIYESKEDISYEYNSDFRDDDDDNYFGYKKTTRDDNPLKTSNKPFVKINSDNDDGEGEDVFGIAAYCQAAAKSAQSSDNSKGFSDQIKFAILYCWAFIVMCLCTKNNQKDCCDQVDIGQGSSAKLTESSSSSIKNRCSNFFSSKNNISDVTTNANLKAGKNDSDNNHEQTEIELSSFSPSTNNM